MLQLYGLNKQNPYQIKNENALLPIPSKAFKFNGHCEYTGRLILKEMLDTSSSEPGLGDMAEHLVNGRLREITEKDGETKLVFRFKKHKGVTDKKNYGKTIKRVLEMVDFRQEKVKQGIIRSFYYNFTVLQLKKLLAEESLEYIAPKRFHMGGFGDSLFLKINKKFYEV